MSHASGPRSNAYSVSKFTNWTAYDPFFAEARIALKRYDSTIPKSPKRPRVIVLPNPCNDFIQPCSVAEVLWKLTSLPPESIAGLRAIFILAGTRKQEKSWHGSLMCYGCYWRNCVFLHAVPWSVAAANRDAWKNFYLHDVLVHEIGHHVDRERDNPGSDKEAFAYAYVERDWRMRQRKLA